MEMLRVHSVALYSWLIPFCIFISPPKVAFFGTTTHNKWKQNHTRAEILRKKEWVLLQIDTDSPIMKADELTHYILCAWSQNNDAVSQRQDLSQEHWTGEMDMITVLEKRKREAKE